jgi:hypothetical protein
MILGPWGALEYNVNPIETGLSQIHRMCFAMQTRDVGGKMTAKIWLF